MYEQSHSGWLRHIDIMVIDLFILELSFLVAFMLRHGWVNLYAIPIYCNMSIMIGVFHICIVFFLEEYTDIMDRGAWNECKRVVQHNSMLLGLLFLYMFLIQESAEYSRTVLFLTWFLDCVVMLPSRQIWKNRKKISKKRKKNGIQLFVVTSKEYYEDTMKRIKLLDPLQYDIDGLTIVDFGNDEMQDIAGSKTYSLIPLDSIMEYVCNQIVDAVYINLEPQNAKITEYINRFVEMGIAVHINLENVIPNTPNRQIEEMAGGTVMSSRAVVATTRQKVIKRMIDIVGSILGIFIMLIAMIIFGPIIHMQSRGSIFYRQVRIGKNGRKFKIIKFRTMYLDAEQRKKELLQHNKMDGHMFKMEDDPRIIPIGRFLRKMSIDELPQFINVLFGDMSLVGTRPPTLEEYENYEYHHHKRLATKPGITGLWQISGRNTITNFEEIVQLDKKYICNWSLSLDAKILWKTVGVVLKAKRSM